MSTVITPNQTPGILRRQSTPAACERVRSKELLGTERCGSPATVKYVDRSSSPPHSSPGHSPQLKGRQARKAIRRAYSSQESGGRPERKPPDARRLRPPPLELTIQQGANKEARGSIQSPLSPDVSSLSSYKETSPECEISPPQTAQTNTSSVQDSDKLATEDSIPLGADFRTRNRTPTGRSSLESRLRKRPAATRSGPNSPYRHNSDPQRRVSSEDSPRNNDSATRSQTPSRTSSNVSKSTFYTPESSRKSSFSREPSDVGNAEIQQPRGSAPSSQQSSVVGIDWLFDGDSDSSNSSGMFIWFYLMSY